MKNKKRVFITGVAGFLGSHIAEDLVRKGHEVSGCDHLRGGYLENIPQGVEFFQFDLCDLEETSQKTQGTDLIIHAAAPAYDGLSVFSPHSVSTELFNSTTSVVTAAIKNEVRDFIFMSSMARYGRQPTPFIESMAVAPETPYGIAKVAGEQLLENLSKIHGFNYAVCVPHNIIGPRQRYDDPYRNVAAIMINRMLQEKQPIIYGDGEQKRCFSYVDDCVQVISRMIDEGWESGLTINIGPDEELITINQLCRIIAEELGFQNLEPIYVGSRANEVEVATCSSDLARTLYGYNTEFELRRGISEMVKWLKCLGPKDFSYDYEVEIQSSISPKTWTDRMF